MKARCPACKELVLVASEPAITGGGLVFSKHGWQVHRLVQGQLRKGDVMCPASGDPLRPTTVTHGPAVANG